MSTNLQTIAKGIARSKFLQRGRLLWEKNQTNFGLPLSKLDKLMVGIYLIINDYSDGKFPPSFNDQKTAYEAEINYYFSLPGVSANEAIDSGMRKPFWFGERNTQYLKDFLELVSIFESLSVTPPPKNFGTWLWHGMDDRIFSFNGF